MSQVGRRDFLRQLGAAALTTLPLTAGAAPPRPLPNIVLILADDMGWGDVGFNGRRDWHTPNLDRLARQGTIFNRWYTASPLCAPSRAALLTGKYGVHNGVIGNAEDLPASEVTVAEALKRRGYVTGLFGKWHSGIPRPGSSLTHPMDQGFDEFFGYTSAGAAHVKYPRRLWSGREERPVSGYADTLFTDHALDFVRRNRDRPFFLFLSLTNPHFNIEAPPPDVARFQGRFREKDPFAPVNATYAAMVSRLDTEAGRLLKELEHLKLDRNTVVVFTSDNGASFEVGNRGASAYHDSNRPFRGQKRNLWEGGIRVPAVVRWPGRVPAGKTSDQVLHMIDLMPTLLGAARLRPDPAWNVDGRNMLHVWWGWHQAPPRLLFWEFRTEGYYHLAAMRGDYKLIVTGTNLPELYNVATDPAERINIYNDYLEPARQMHHDLWKWLSDPANRPGTGRMGMPPPPR